MGANQNALRSLNTTGRSFAPTPTLAYKFCIILICISSIFSEVEHLLGIFIGLYILCAYFLLMSFAHSWVFSLLICRNPSSCDGCLLNVCYVSSRIFFWLFWVFIRFRVWLLSVWSLESTLCSHLACGSKQRSVVREQERSGCDGLAGSSSWSLSVSLCPQCFVMSISPFNLPNIFWGRNYLYFTDQGEE